MKTEETKPDASELIREIEWVLSELQKSDFPDDIESFYQIPNVWSDYLTSRVMLCGNSVRLLTKIKQHLEGR